MISPPQRPAAATVSAAQRAAALLVVCALGTAHVLPELANPIWQDEAATLMSYAAGSPRAAFSDYSMLNNHMLFSAALALVWSPGESGAGLRLLPLLSWLLSLAVLGLACRRFSFAARLSAIALFGASALTVAFALQLRGYAFSWPFALAALASVRAFVSDGRRDAALVYSAACTALVLILPSNALVGALCALWASLVLWREDRVTAAARWRALAALVLPGLLLGLYWPHAEQLRGHAAAGWSRWSDAALLGHWLLALFGQYLLLLPLFVLGLSVRARDEASHEPLPGRDHAGLLLGALAGGTALAVLVLPVALYPRALVPLLPLWYLALGALLARAWWWLGRRWPQRPRALAAIALLACFVLPYLMPACGGWWRGPADRADLCQQYYRGDYAPAAALAFLERSKPGRANPIMADSEAAWALGFLAWNRRLDTLRLVEYRAWRQTFAGHQRPRLVVMQRGAALTHLLGRAGLGRPRRFERVFDEGFFEIWYLQWDAPAAPDIRAEEPQ